MSLKSPVGSTPAGARQLILSLLAACIVTVSQESRQSETNNTVFKTELLCVCDTGKAF